MLAAALIAGAILGVTSVPSEKHPGVCRLSTDAPQSGMIALRLGRKCAAVGAEEFFDPTGFGRDYDFIEVLERAAKSMHKPYFVRLCKRSLPADLADELVKRKMGAFVSLELIDSGYSLSFRLRSRTAVVDLDMSEAGEILGVGELVE